MPEMTVPENGTDEICKIKGCLLFCIQYQWTVGCIFCMILFDKANNSFLVWMLCNRKILVEVLIYQKWLS